MNDLDALLRSKFDRVYILSLVDRKDRQTSIMKQLDAFGLPAPDTTEFIRWHWAVRFPYNDLISDAFNYSNRGSFTKPNEYDCARNHYNIVKTAHALGRENILVMEDDILFLRDKVAIAGYVAGIPDDYDILQFGGFTDDPYILRYIDEQPDRWIKHKHVGVWNCSMYALSRRGMEYYTAFMDRFFWVADGPLYKAPINDHLVTTYLSREPVVIQADKNEVASDIRDASNDKIDYNKQNVYETKINKLSYFQN